MKAPSHNLGLTSRRPLSKMFSEKRVKSAFEAVEFALTPPCDHEEKVTFLDVLHNDDPDTPDQLENFIEPEMFDELTDDDLAELIRRLKVRFAMPEDGCVYCGDEAVYQCDGCVNSDNGDGGLMCRVCMDEHGHEVGAEILCGGCFETRHA